MTESGNDKKIIDVQDMLTMQRELQNLHIGEWDPVVPEYARNSMLYSVEELGECIAIIKKKGDKAIMDDPAVRENFCTELSDVLMYLSNVMLCYDISAEELSRAFINKNAHNMKRNYRAQNEKLYEDRPFEENTIKSNI